jgi:hypothetical protein
MTYAVHTIARITLVSILPKVVSLCNLQCARGDNLVEGVWGSGEHFAGIAMAINNVRINASFYFILAMAKAWRYRDLPQNMSLLILVQLRSPLCVAAMALSVVCRHICLASKFDYRFRKDGMVDGTTRFSAMGAGYLYSSRLAPSKLAPSRPRCFAVPLLLPDFAGTPLLHASAWTLRAGYLSNVMRRGERHAGCQVTGAVGMTFLYASFNYFPRLTRTLNSFFAIINVSSSALFFLSMF